jgi:hypothetical protein
MPAVSALIGFGIQQMEIPQDVDDFEPDIS